MALVVDFSLHPQFEFLSAETRAGYYAARVHSAVAWAWEHAPATRRRLQAAGLHPGAIHHPTDLDALPVLAKDDLIALQQAEPPFGGLLGAPLSQLKRVFMSPGPIYDPEGRELDYWRFAPALRGAGFTADDVVQNIFPYNFTPAGAMFDGACQALGCTILPTGVGRNEDQIRIMQAAGATAYTGLPSYLMALIRAAEEAGHDFQRHYRLRKACVTAEPLPPSLRAVLTDYGIHTRQCYGAADAGCLAYECEAAEGMHLNDGVYLTICDPATGQPLPGGQAGEVVVTLLQTTYPLLRFGVGDLSQIDDRPCACGRTTPRLTGILGRVGEGVKVRGLFVHPSQAKEVFAGFPQVQRWRLVVTRAEHVDHIVAEVETVGEIGDLETALHEKIKVRTPVMVVPVGAIPQEAKAIEDRRKWE